MTAAVVDLVQGVHWNCMLWYEGFEIFAESLNSSHVHSNAIAAIRMEPSFAGLQGIAGVVGRCCCKLV